ncbi:MAG: ferric reductase-like transmembrane domain-containing protein [Alphaproteobacteria bacterium]|nr:ferric reductase-like transmembrane domain-containing protein [Alphaproteobacteria bacterium]
MSHGYVPVQWTPHKKRYDAVIAGGVALWLGCFIGGGAALYPDVTAETLIIRGVGTAAIVMLHLILCIGPLARLDKRFLVLLYNRRHLGVTMFLLAAVHGVFSLIQFHALGDMNPLVSLLVANPRLDSVSQLPFQPLGAAALGLLFLMAATSHDFWLKNLTAPVWKALHMGVYLAYVLIVLHVALGVLQAETSPVWAGLLGLGALTVSGLHLVAGRAEAPGDLPRPDSPAEEGFVEVCGVDEIPELRARVVPLGGERVAVFRYAGKVSAVSNVCQHQNGPLGEGKVIDGCITCPWHGFQYLPETGASPPPFTEKVPTFRVRVRGGRVFVHPTPLPAGTHVEPARVEEPADA